MITVKDKKDAIVKIKELGLNHFPVEIFSVTDKAGIKKFFDKYKAEEYVLRNPSRAKAKFYFVKSFEEAEKLLPKFKTEVTVVVSYRPYKENIVLMGDIKISRNYGAGTVDLTARSDSEATQRNIYEEPEYNLHASLDEDRVWKICGFDKIARYISDHELYDVIVEFGVYSCKLGVNKENIVITEIRTGY